MIDIQLDNSFAILRNAEQTAVCDGIARCEVQMSNFYATSAKIVDARISDLALVRGTGVLKLWKKTIGTCQLVAWSRPSWPNRLMAYPPDWRSDRQLLGDHRRRKEIRWTV